MKAKHSVVSKLSLQIRIFCSSETKKNKKRKDKKTLDKPTEMIGVWNMLRL